MRVKNSGIAPGLANKFPVPGGRKIWKCLTPGTDEAGKCPAVARGGGGGLGAAGIDCCIMQYFLRLSLPGFLVKSNGKTP